MSYLQKQMDFLRFDRRLLEINLKNGTLSQTEYDQYLEKLSDSAGNAEKLELNDDSSDAALDSLNGGAQSAAQPVQQETAATTPTNTDPFGSGF